MAIKIEVNTSDNMARKTENKRSYLGDGMSFGRMRPLLGARTTEYYSIFASSRRACVVDSQGVALWNLPKPRLARITAMEINPGQNRCFLGYSNRCLAIIDYKTGGQINSFRIPFVPLLIIPARSQELILCGNRSLHVLNIDSGELRMMTRIEQPFGQMVYNSQGDIFYQQKNGALVSIETDSTRINTDSSNSTRFERMFTSNDGRLLMGYHVDMGSSTIEWRDCISLRYFGKLRLDGKVSAAAPYGRSHFLINVGKELLIINPVEPEHILPRFTLKHPVRFIYNYQDRYLFTQEASGKIVRYLLPKQNVDDIIISFKADISIPTSKDLEGIVLGYLKDILSIIGLKYESAIALAGSRRLIEECERDYFNDTANALIRLREVLRENGLASSELDDFMNQHFNRITSLFLENLALIRRQRGYWQSYNN